MLSSCSAITVSERDRDRGEEEEGSDVLPVVERQDNVINPATLTVSGGVIMVYKGSVALLLAS